jgi:hypothetical protein
MAENGTSIDLPSQFGQSILVTDVINGNTNTVNELTPVQT